MNIFVIYLIAINVVAATVFVYDKFCAEHHHWRVPEMVLHLLELMGGVAAILFFMYAIHHKNRKFSYYVWTYLILILWVAGIWVYLNGWPEGIGL